MKCPAGVTDRRPGRRRFERKLRRAVPLEPLSKEPAEVPSGRLREDSLQVMPFCMTPAILRDQAFQREPERLLPDFLP